MGDFWQGLWNNSYTFNLGMFAHCFLYPFEKQKQASKAEVMDFWQLPNVRNLQPFYSSTQGTAS